MPVLYRQISLLSLSGGSSFLRPSFAPNIIDIGIIVFITIGKHSTALKQEGTLVKCIFVRELASLNDLLLSCIEEVGGIRGRTIFLTTED